MSAIATLNSLRFYEMGPIIERLGDGSRLELVNTETEIKNIYRILQVIQPLISALDAGVASADGEEAAAVSSKAGTHDLSDATIHTDVGTGPHVVNGNEEDGVFLSFEKTTDGQWKLCRNINQDPVDTDSSGSYPHRVGCFKGSTSDDETFNSAAAIGGSQKFRMISAVSGSFLKLTKASSTEDIQIAFDNTLFKLSDAADAFYTGGGPTQFDLLVADGQSPPQWTNTKPRLEKVMSDVTVSSIAVGEILVNTQATIADWQNQTLSEAGIISADGTVPLTADWDVGAFKVTAQQIAADIADGTTPLIVTSTTKVANLNAETIDAGGTARDWDNVEYVRQIFLPRVVTVGASEGWVTGSSGASLAEVTDASPPSEYAGYACRIPGSWKAASTVTLKWRFHNASVQSGGDQKVVEWRITYNSAGASGTISAADTAAPTNTLDTDQPVNTIKTQSITLSNIAADDLLNVTISVDDGSTTAVGDIIVLDCPWVEATLQGIPDDSVEAS